eukprot:4860679-Amphidinium_carterae.2
MVCVLACMPQPPMALARKVFVGGIPSYFAKVCNAKVALNNKHSSCGVAIGCVRNALNICLWPIYHVGQEDLYDIFSVHGIVQKAWIQQNHQPDAGSAGASV